MQYNNVLLVSNDGTAPEKVTKSEALKRAENAGLTLVQVSVSKDTSICKIMDYDKWVYDQKKKEKANKKPKQQTKEVKIHDATQENDLRTKARTIDRILKDGDRVKVEIMYKGRQVAYIARGADKLNDLKDMVTTPYIVDKPIKTDGNKVFMVLAPK